MVVLSESGLRAGVAESVPNEVDVKAAVTVALVEGPVGEAMPEDVGMDVLWVGAVEFTTLVIPERLNRGVCGDGRCSVFNLTDGHRMDHLNRLLVLYEALVDLPLFIFKEKSNLTPSSLRGVDSCKVSPPLVFECSHLPGISHMYWSDFLSVPLLLLGISVVPIKHEAKGSRSPPNDFACRVGRVSFQISQG